MRIHVGSAVDSRVLHRAARVAGVDLVDLTEHNSRTHESAFNVTLAGNSRRRPNRDHGPDEYAATWDQWGVFLAYVFAADQTARVGGAKHPTYASAADFNYKTNWRFAVEDYWPADAHGDHTFRFAGTARQQACTKCSALQNW